MRRRFLKHLTTFAGSIWLSGSGLFKAAYAAWPSDNFKEQSYQDTLTRLFNQAELIETHKIKIKAPKTAENGAVVPVTIQSDLPNIGKVYILVDNNPKPLSAEFNLSNDVDFFITARIKMAASGQLIIIAMDNENIYKASRFVKVSKGGCGN